MEEDIHTCEKKEGKIQDVTFDYGGNIYCRGCGNVLKESQVHSGTLVHIKSRIGGNR